MAEQTHLPGFRFHPTEEELLEFYLKQMVFGKPRHTLDVIGFLNIYQHHPWDLPHLAKNGEREWYFFVPRDVRRSCGGGGGGGRPNRTTGIGYWKATGSDRRILKLSDPYKRLIGLRKTLVFYKGRAPKGTKTDWVMNEYRLPNNSSLPSDIVLCKIYRKATSLKVLEQRAMEEETKNNLQMNNNNNNNNFIMADEDQQAGELVLNMAMKKEAASCGEDREEEEEDVGSNEATTTTVAVEGSSSLSSRSIQIPKGFEMLTDLQVPKMNMDWTQDQFWNQFLSPWILNFTSTPTNILNF